MNGINNLKLYRVAIILTITENTRNIIGNAVFTLLILHLLMNEIMIIKDNIKFIADKIILTRPLNENVSKEKINKTIFIPKQKKYNFLNTLLFIIFIPFFT